MTSKTYLTGDMEKFMKTIIQLSKSDNIEDIQALYKNVISKITSKLLQCSNSAMDESLLAQIYPVAPVIQNLNVPAANIDTVTSDFYNNPDNIKQLDDGCIVIEEMSGEIRILDFFINKVIQSLIPMFSTIQ